MKLSALLIGLLLASGVCLGQTKPAPITKLAQCQAEVKVARSAETDWSARYYEGQAERDMLANQSKELEAKNAELTKRLSETIAIARDLLKSDQAFYPAAAQLEKDHNALIEKYNRLLAIAQNQEAQLQAVNSRQQRINNALAVYGMMPKYNPPQTLNLRVSNCTALPALCVN